MTILIIVLSLLSLVGIYWSIFWYRNKDLLMGYLKERHARKDLLCGDASGAKPRAQPGATTAT